MKYWNSPYGKEESWYIIGKRTDADEPPYVLLGFKEGASIEEYSKYYFAGDVPSMEKTIARLHENGLFVPVIVGGAVLTPDYAKKIGADYYARDAKQSADIAKSILG